MRILITLKNNTGIPIDLKDDQVEQAMGQLAKYGIIIGENILIPPFLFLSVTEVGKK